MSQYNFCVHSNIGEVLVSIGWDKQLQHFFMNIYQKTEESPIYDNLFEQNPFQLTLEYYQGVLNKFAITDISLTYRSQLYMQLMSDKFS